MTSPLSNDTINNHHHPTNNNNNHIHPSLQEAVDDDDAVAASPLMTTTTNGNYHDHDDDDISKTTTTAKTTTGDSPIPNEPLKEDQEPSPPPPEQPQSDEEMASLQDTLKFVFDCGTSARIMFVLGCIAAIGNGMVYPIIAYVFSNSFTSVSSVSSNTGSNNGLAAIRKLAFTFLLVGVYGWIVGFLQFWLFHQIAHRASHAFQCQWFHALLRQDTAFYDVYDIGGLASQIGPNALLFRRGVGDKFGEGIQFFTTGVGGIAYAFYSSWRTALVVLCVVPFASLASRSVLTLNQSKSARAAEAYQTAGSVAYTTVAAIKTVLSLNAITKMIHDYHQATLQAYLKSISFLWKQGLANGCMLGSFMVLYAVVTLFGTYLMYRDIAQFGCDPSGGVHDNTTCQQSGPKVFGAMLGIGFAARGISQVGNFLETLSAARVATYPALQAIQRTPGAPAQILYNNKAKTIQVKEEGDDDHEEEEEHSTSRTIRALLPEYRIYPSSTDGLRPEHVQGTISLRNVSFSYPTRPQKPVLQEVSIDIAARTTVAIVGPSGGGKSTIAALLERFYDPQSGSVELDGMNIQDINVKHLRGLIGYVGQEPTLFATTIAGNIQYGNLNATQDMIEEAARKANAHDFIMSFPDGYNTQVGDKGAQLSGGQKQRIAIARVLVGNPSILLLDEATSALDSESELVVQEALDHVVAEQKRTTIIIAHRLSTIRNADMIVVLVNGRVAEQGTHDDLMTCNTGHYRNLIRKQERGPKVSGTPSRENSHADLTKLAAFSEASHTGGATPQFAFKDVVFAYPTRPQKKVFKGFNLTVTQGETVALVGPSGGGKSTTVALIERFYDPLEGSVEYLGHDIKSLNLKWYRDQIGYVGQEPTLFNETIANNIAYGAPNATMEEIIEAAKQANAHEFIMSFTDGYNTPVGERGTQLSGGQKQRVAIARALVKKPMVLLLDEATSALDTDSEAVVQAALDNLMASFDRTTIVIAHRLSTVRNADKIAFIADGVVKEFGSHDELLEIPHGRYKRLVDAQRRGSTLDSIGEILAMRSSKHDDDLVFEYDWKAEVEEEEKKAFSLTRARKMAAPDSGFMAIGSIGALMAGGVYPMWGLTFGHTIGILFQQVLPCSPGNVPPNPYGNTCGDYWGGTAHNIRFTSYRLAGYWIIIGVGAVVGNMLTYWGFGMASERLSKRVRDGAFSALVRQEASYFDKRSVGTITSQLQDDAARIQSFSGEPVRSLIIAVASVVTGIVLAFAFMWPFALLAMVAIPFMSIAAARRAKTMVGEDLGTGRGQDGLNSPGGILVETLLNIRTVSALTLEERRYEDFENALRDAEADHVRDGLCSGVSGGLAVFLQQWVNAFLFWWGGYLLFHHPDEFSFEDFLVSNFSLLFALFGLGSALQGISDRKEAETSAGRIFYLLDRQSEIDPLSKEGKTLD